MKYHKDLKDQKLVSNSNQNSIQMSKSDLETTRSFLFKRKKRVIFYFLKNLVLYKHTLPVYIARKIDIKKLQSKDNQVFKLKKTSWFDQFKNAVNVNNGDECASTTDHILHSIAFGWKLILSILIPPSLILRGWPCFIISLSIQIFLAKFIFNLTKIFERLTNISNSIIPLKYIAYFFEYF